MTGALYSAVAGLRTHMSKLNVIGNNIANVNTYSYKTTRMTFEESIATTARAGTNSGNSAGGVNPTQYGYGSVVSSVDVNMASSTYSPTGYAMDCMISGDGFFMVGDKDGTFTSVGDMSSLSLTRVGDFRPDSAGYITDGNGNVVYGFAYVQNPDYDPNATDAQVLENPTIRDATILSTDLVPLRYPLAAVAPTLENGGITEVEVTNDDGTTSTTEVYNWQEGDAVYEMLSAPDPNNGNAMYNISAAPEWVDASGDGIADDDELLNYATDLTTYPLGQGITQVVANANDYQVQLSSMSISEDGMISGINAATGDPVVVGYLAVATVDNTSGVTNMGSRYYAAMGGAGNIRVSLLGGLAEGLYFGNKTPTMVDGVEQMLGISDLDAIGNAGGVSITAYGLEASSVDLAVEMSEMITTQRGYQANTRIVTVTDSMLEELVNLKR